MSPDADTSTAAPDGEGWLALTVLALLAGATSGFVASLFRLALDRGDQWRDAVIGWAHGRSLLGFLVVVAGAAGAAAVAAWLVRRFAPYAGGSGIPHVEAVVNAELPPAPVVLVPVKFLGGWLAIGAGLALGREGPSVQMGAGLSWLLGKACRLRERDCLALLAAGAGTGLATAFNAPVAGAVFVLEELVRRFDPRIAIAALAASGAGIAVAWLLIGQRPDFRVEVTSYPAFASVPLFLVLGLVAGLAGAAYNAALLLTLSAADRLDRWPLELRASVIGAGVGVVAWLAPGLVGGGDALTQRVLSGAASLAWLPLAFLLRFVLGAASYAAGTPGGLFAPMLVLGAQLGLLFGSVASQPFSDPRMPATAFAVVGMAAFFTAVVRAPLTGIVLITEMTAGLTLLLPMLLACSMAMLVPTVLSNAPIYDSLRERTVHAGRRT